MPTEVLAGTSTYWRVEGHGARRAILLHCTFAHSGAWKGVMADLRDLLTMEAMDLPAHGRSGGRDIAMTWQAQSAAMVVDLIARNDAPVDLIGHSFGATIALRLAVARPELVRSLTLIEPVFFSAARDAGRAEYAAHMADHGGFVDLLEAGDFEGAARGFSDMWGGPQKWADQSTSQRQYIIDRIGLIRDSSDTAVGVGADYVPLSDVAKIAQPVLLIEGDKSDPIIAAVQQSLDDVLPNSRRAVIKDAGHMAPLTHPAMVAASIRKFLSP